jgi:glycosyltransferase involved in cell wall biosynthesis
MAAIQPLVSVVIPVHDGEAFVRAAVMSVLRQTHVDLECLVVDDGSTDGTAGVLASISDDRLQVVRQAQRGVSAARNAGIALARGDYVAFLDADDVWFAAKLERQLAALASDPTAGMAICPYVITDADLGPTMVIRPDRNDLTFRRWMLSEGNGILLSSTAVVERGALHGEPWFDETLSMSADLDVALRVAAQTRVVVADEPLVLYRAHKTQMHRDLVLLERDMERVLTKHAALDAAMHRRGRANLHTRLLVYSLRLRRAGALRHLVVAARSGPARIVALPVEAMVRRTRRRATQRRDLKSAVGRVERERKAWR